MIKLIGLTGKARSGKDTVGEYLRKYGYQPYAMAKPIKEGCRQMFGWDDRHLYGELKEVLDPAYGVTPREAMQKLGTEFGRNMISTKIWELRAAVEISNSNYLVITDLRFDNEAALVLSNGGIVIDINREGRDKINGAEDHSSESGISPELITKVIDNNGTIDMLYENVDSCILLSGSGYDL